MKINTIKSHQAWTVKDIENNNFWYHSVSAEELKELKEHLHLIKRDGDNFINLIPPKDMIKINALAARMLQQLTDGYGMFLLKGIPIDEDALKIYWLLSMFLGKACIQTRKGCLLYSLKNEAPAKVGEIVDGELVRGTKTNDEIGLHTDPCHILGMLCLQTSTKGGESTLVSTITIHNEMYKENKSLLEELYKPFYSDRQYINLDGYSNISDNPYFKYENNALQVQCNRNRIESAQKHDSSVPRLTQKQIEALDLFDEIANRPENKLTVTLENGDIILLNNNITLHGRKKFDDANINAPRHYVRIWLSNPLITSMPSLFGYPM